MRRMPRRRIVEPDADAKLLVVVTVYEVSEMTERSLQVTYRKGRAFAAYLHLSHQTGEKSAQTVAAPVISHAPG
jgi:hypothetical protein